VGINSCKVRCNYHKNRRPFTAKDAARVICYAIAGGYTWNDIRKEAEKRCLVVLAPNESPCDCQALMKQIERYQALTAGMLTAAALAIPLLKALRAKKYAEAIGKVGGGKKLLDDLLSTETALEQSTAAYEGEMLSLETEYATLNNSSPVKIIEP
jgi:hypothetical protein